MKVLIINTVRDGFSTGKIAYRFCKKLNSNGHEAILAYGYEIAKTESVKTIRISNRFEFFIHHCINVLTGYHSAWAPLPMKRLKKIYEEFNPDIVQLYNLHGYYLDIYKLFGFLSQKKARVVYGMLDEHPYMGYCAYPFECTQFQNGCKNCQSIKFRGYLGSLFFNRARETFLMKQSAYAKNNICFTGPKWVLERARSSELLKNARLYEIDEFIDNVNTYVPRDKSIVRNKLGIADNEIMILNVAPSGDKRKGVSDFIDYARRLQDVDKRLRFVNVGNQEDEATLPRNYIGVNYVSNQIELSEYYSAADILFCTSHADTMPNVCLEALSCGTPVMGYNETGVPYVAEEPLGEFFEPNDINGIIDYLCNLNRKSAVIEKECREYALKRYSLDVYYSKQLEVYNYMMKEY